MKIYNLYRFFIILSFFTLIITSCTKEAPTVNPADYIIEPQQTIQPGYYYPFVTAVYPADGTTGVAINSQYVILFNMAVDADDFASEISVIVGGTLYSYGSDYSITPTTGQSTSAAITFTSQLPASTNVTVTVGSGIHELVSGTDVQIVLTEGAGYSWTFTTGTAPDVTSPSINGSVQVPADFETDVVLDTTIQLNFNESPASGEIDITSVNNTTFYVEEDVSGQVVACTYSYTAATNTVTLTPTSNLETGKTYNVIVTTGIKDLAGNYLSTGTSWSFDTVTTIDPLGGNPTITIQPSVSYVTDTTADISWATNEATTCTLSYGQGDDTADDTDTDGVMSSYHFLSLGSSPPPPALSSGRRYYARLFYTDYIDYAGNTGALNDDSDIAEFNTETDEEGLFILQNLDINDDSQSGLNWIESSFNSGAFLFWREYNTGVSQYHIYGQLVDSGFTGQWNSGNRLPLYNGNTTTYLSSVEDGIGGVIVLTTQSGTDIYAKRVDESGVLDTNWGYVAGDSGLSIGTGTKASAVPVYSDVFTAIASGTTEMESLGLLNPFVDYGNDLSGLTDGFVIMDPNNHNGTTIDNNTATQDYVYILGQNANIIASGDTFYIGDNVTDTISFTARNHNMNVNPDYNNGGNIVCTEHGITLADLTAENIGVGDIIQYGTSYGYITGVSEITVSSIDSGTANADRTNHLIDGTADFTAATAVEVDDVAYNTTSLLYENISAVTVTDLTLDSDLFPNGNEGYEIYETICSGTSDSYNDTTNILTDSGVDFYNTYGVRVDDIIINLTDGSSTTIVAVGPPTPLGELELADDIFNTSGGDDYRIIDDAASAIKSGSANADRASHLIDGTKTWLATVTVNDLVVRTSGAGAPQYATVSVVTDTDLTLSADIFPNGNEDYEIYHNYCTTHTTEPIDTFVQLTINWTIGVANGGSVTLYNTLITGTANTLRTNPLYDNDGGLGSVAVNDIVLNFNAGGSWTYVNNITYRGSGALGLAANIMSDANYYRIVRSSDGVFTTSNITDIGIAAGGAGTTLVTDGGATVYPGDVAYNLTDSDFAIVSSAAGANLTLLSNAQFNSGDYYVIVRGSVLYSWQNGTVINASIRSLTDGTLLVSFSPLIANAQNPYTVSDGNGNAYLVYLDTSGAVDEIRIRLLDATGQNVWTPTAAPEVSAQSSVDETIIKIMSDGTGGVVVLYQYSNGTYQGLRAQRITNAGTVATLNWGTNGYDIGNPAAVDDITAVDMVYNGTDDIIVAAQIGNKIWARRMGTVWTGIGLGTGQYISNPTDGEQNNPKIFVDGWAGDTIFVWEDSRFTSSAGYGIFGMQVDSATGVKDTGWLANNSGTNDYNGVSIILNAANVYVPNLQIVPYNSGTEAMLIWEDVRYNTVVSPTRGVDLLYIDLDAFTPY